MKAMTEVEKATACAKLESATHLFFVAIRLFEDIPDEHPQLDRLIDNLFESMSRGDFQLDLTAVIGFLRDEIDDEDGYIRNRSLGWNTENEEEEGDGS